MKKKKPAINGKSQLIEWEIILNCKINLCRNCSINSNEKKKKVPIDDALIVSFPDFDRKIPLRFN